MTAVIPVQSKVKSYPQGSSVRRCSLILIPCSSVGFQHSVHPSSLARENFSLLRSIPTILRAPRSLHAYTTARPTAPSPKITVVEFG